MHRSSKISLGNEINPDALSKVIAVAMDMNASYHKLVEKYILQAEIF